MKPSVYCFIVCLISIVKCAPKNDPQSDYDSAGGDGTCQPSSVIPKAPIPIPLPQISISPTTQWRCILRSRLERATVGGHCERELMQNESLIERWPGGLHYVDSDGDGFVGQNEERQIFVENRDDCDRTLDPVFQIQDEQGKDCVTINSIQPSSEEIYAQCPVKRNSSGQLIAEYTQNPYAYAEIGTVLSTGDQRAYRCSQVDGHKKWIEADTVTHESCWHDQSNAVVGRGTVVQADSETYAGVLGQFRCTGNDTWCEEVNSIFTEYTCNNGTVSADQKTASMCLLQSSCNGGRYIPQDRCIFNQEQRTWYRCVVNVTTTAVETDLVAVDSSQLRDDGYPNETLCRLGYLNPIWD